MQPKVFLTRPIVPECVDALRRESSLSLQSSDRPATREEILAGCAQVQGLVCILHDDIDEEVIASAPDLKVISNYAVGYNNIDVDAATRRGIAVCNTPGVLTESTAEIAFALMLDAARRVGEGDRLVRSGRWDGWAPMQLLGNGLNGATLGLIGLGRIGRAMVRPAQAFGMEVAYWNRTRLAPSEEIEIGVRYRKLDDLLATVDFLSLHVALAESTRYLIGTAELKRMKSTAVIVNTARGPVIDEAALVDALRDGSIAAAGLDVYEREPILHPGLAELPNVVLSPHLGSATIGTRTKMGHLAVDNALAVLRGDRPPHIVNPQVLA